MFSWVLDLCGLKAQKQAERGRQTERCQPAPWLGKDVVLLILHQAAANDYETFCHVRLVAKWVAKTMNISEPMQAQQVKWRHMVEDVALRRIENEVTHRDQIIGLSDTLYSKYQWPASCVLGQFVLSHY